MRKTKRALLSVIKRYPYFWGSFAAVFVILVLFFSFGYRRQVQFRFADPHCSRDVTILPNVFKPSRSDAYKLTYENSSTIAGYPVIAREACLTALEAPKVGKEVAITARMFNLPFIGKRYSVRPRQLPSLSVDVLGEKISVRDPLVFALSDKDEVFDYVFRADEQEQDCTTRNNEVVCAVEAMNLMQNKQYEISIERKFKSKTVEVITEKNVVTVEPVVITSSSIPDKSVVYDKRNEFRLTTNKPVVRVVADLFSVSGNEKKKVASKVKIDGADIVLRADEQLPRNTQYELVVSDAVAEDRGVISSAYTLHFGVSGGPQVKVFNMPKTGAPTNSPLIITFDQPLGATQDLAKQVTLMNGRQSVAAAFAVNGSSIRISPRVSLPVCATITVKLDNTIQSIYGITGNSAWTYTFRTTCFSVGVIGSSAQGRPIYVYQFGSGARKILFVGTTHGNESNTKNLLDLWIKEVDTNAQRVPTDVTLLIIPNLNPDGFATNDRKNARGVDLNRNFPANDWKPDVTMPGGAFAPGGGGSTSLSEPESRALAEYVLRVRPGLVLTYHSAAAVVTANKAGDSASRAVTYAQLSGYRNLSHMQNSQVFAYDTTGAFEDWLHDKVGISALLIELATTNKDEFSRNRNAMWAALR